jgi:hypothetical protein
MSRPTLTHTKLQVSVQQFFKGVSWTGLLAEATSGTDRSAAIIQTFHPTEAIPGESLSLMRSVGGFMANMPWTGGSLTRSATTPTTAPASKAPVDLDAFSDFF